MTLNKPVAVLLSACVLFFGSIVLLTSCPAADTEGVSPSDSRYEWPSVWKSSSPVSSEEVTESTDLPDVSSVEASSDKQESSRPASVSSARPESSVPTAVSSHSSKDKPPAETAGPQITRQPSGGSVAEGGSVSVTVKAKGKGLTYRWYFRRDGENTFSAWKGYSHPSEKITHDSSWKELLCYCEVTDSAGKTAVSDAVFITLKKLNRILAVGDSICYGGRNSHKGFVGDLGLPYLILAKNGATLSTRETKVTNIPDQLADASGFRPDIVIADGGANDYIYNAPLGRIPASRLTRVSDISGEALGTVMGGLQKLFVLMSVNYPDAQRYFVITHKTTQRLQTKVDGKYVFTEDDRLVDWTVTKNKAGYTQQELHDAIAACCRVYGVTVIDVYQNSSLNTANAKYRSESSYLTDPSATKDDYVDIDGVHPLERGYREFYLPLMRRYIKTQTETSELPLEILRQPQSVTVTQGESVTLLMKASGTKLKYQWYFRKEGQDSFSVWKGRTHDTETVVPGPDWNGIRLYCTVTDGKGKSLKTDTVTVTVNPQADSENVE